jgi:hypothetical protein
VSKLKVQTCYVERKSSFCGEERKSWGMRSAGSQRKVSSEQYGGELMRKGGWPKTVVTDDENKVSLNKIT